MSENSPRVPQPLAPYWARNALSFALLYFPVCGLAHMPLGGAGRYLSVLAGPVALAFLLVWHRREWRALGPIAWRFTSPFVPWFAASLVVVIAYPNATIGDPFSRVAWALAIALASVRALIAREVVFSVAAAGSIIYGAAAVHDIFIVGGPQAGIDTHPIVFAQTAMLTGGLAVTGAWAAPNAQSTLRALWFALGCTGLAAGTLSYSRGAFAGVIVLALLLAADAWRHDRRHAATVLISVLAALAIFLLITPFGDRVSLGWTQASDYITARANQNSVGIRLELWRIALTSINEQPLLGYGYTNVLQLSERLPALKFLSADMLEGLHHFHSDWIHALMAGGIVLTLGLGATVAVLAYEARFDLPRLWLIGAMIIFGLTDLAFFRKPTVTLFIAAWALLFATAVRSEHERETHTVHR